MTTPIDDGGPAFPRTPMDDIRDEIRLQEIGGLQKGMTLRQWYAGQALPGVIGATQNTDLSARGVAAECILYADAMIAELDKDSGDG